MELVNTGRGHGYTTATYRGWGEIVMTATRPKRQQQCLCCKEMIQPGMPAFEAIRKDDKNTICQPCYAELKQTDSAALYQLSRYKHEGRILQYPKV